MSTQETAVTSPLERRIDLSVAMADIDADVAERLKRLARTVKMAGFRPGKVPMKLVEQNYGPQARSEAIGAAVEKTFAAKVQEQKLRVAGYPTIEPKAAAAADASNIEFSAVFEVYPEVALADVSGKEIERATFTLTDAEVDKTIDVLRKQGTTFVGADRAAAKEDRVTVDFTGRKDGVEFPGGKAEGYPFVIGQGQMLPDFETAAIGLKAGDKKTFEMTFPADYQATELAGNKVEFDITVQKVEAPQVPELDAEFAKRMGIADGDLAKMRAEVKGNLDREVQKRLQSRVKQQVLDALLEANPVEVPKALIEAESQQMAQAAVQDMASRGMNTKDIPVNPAWFTEQAVRRVKLGLILAELVKAKELRAKPEQVRAVVEDFASTFEQPEQVIHWYYSQPQRLAEAEALAVENNVVDWMLANAKVADKPIGFDELMGNAA
ncbi:MAG TPA: trigger factor [Rhodocyclaceae bacterium]|nr:trigger factor [Rhodocyclaceae bacterium]